ncbi:MAG: dihydrofolate reductase [Casimicrobiaceae bacterium]
MTLRSGTPALALLAALARNRVIGVANALPWRLPADLRHFRTLTTGHTIVMGRKTWESIGRALPDRQNIVVTRRPDYAAAGAQVVASLDGALAEAARPAPVFCIGGGELYRAALDRADALYLTEIDADFAGDTTFPEFDRSAWRETAREAHAADAPGGLAYAFVTYRRDCAAAPA